MAIRPEERAGVADRDLSDSTVLITGASDGIGREAALALGRLGATVLVHGRSGSKVGDAVEAVRREGTVAEGYAADFTSLGAVRDLAGAVADDHGTVDVLANNAGTYFGEGRVTDAGVEATMTVNHLAPFLLTHRLLPAIPDDGRIVTTASGAHQGVSLDPDRLDEISGYDGFRAYARSKLANILFTRELARRLDDRNTNCFHPGFVPGSALWRDSPVYVRAVMRALGAVPDAITRQVIDTPATGAATLVYLAASEEVGDTTGEYFTNFEVGEPSEAARDDELARELWEKSEEVAGVDESEVIGTR